MKSILMACVAGLLITAVPADAKTKNKTVVGCVEAKGSGYDLVATSKKGHMKHYGLAGSHDFSRDVGHRIQVSGMAGKGVLTANSVRAMGGSCR